MEYMDGHARMKLFKMSLVGSQSATSFYQKLYGRQHGEGKVMEESWSVSEKDY